MHLVLTKSTPGTRIEGFISISSSMLEMQHCATPCPGLIEELLINMLYIRCFFIGSV